MATQVTLNSGSVDSAGSLLLKTNGTTTAVTIDTAQNMGLGVTPSSWSLGKAIEVGHVGNAIFDVASSQLTITQNAYYNGGYKYGASTTASRYDQAAGAHIWYNAASGTAGNAISFTQAMTLDASGNLGVGYTAPSQNFTAGILTGVKGYNIVYTGNGTEVASWTANASTGEVKFGAASSYFPTFWSNGSERARIDSSGNFLVATTNSSDTSGVGFKLRQVSSQTQVSSVCSSFLNTYVLYNTAAGAYRFYVSEAGQIYATSTSITAISDQTLKENVRDLETGLTEVMALQPRRFDWKNGDATNVAGFIAQEVEQVLPELVQDYVYSKDEEGNDITKKSLKMGDILPTLVKAIQEQQAIITSLTARIEALEQA